MRREAEAFISYFTPDQPLEAIRTTDQWYVVSEMSRKLQRFHETHHPPPFIRTRAHHRGSNSLCVEYAEINGHIPIKEEFCRNGIRPTPRLYEYVTSFVLSHYNDMRTNTGAVETTVQNERDKIYKRVVGHDSAGEQIVYSTDFRGNTPEQGIATVSANMKALLYLLTASDRTVYMTAYPDQRCEGCAIGLHCTEDTIEIPEHKHTHTAANAGHRLFHPHDSQLLAEGLKKYPADAFRLIESYAVPGDIPQERIDAWERTQEEQDTVPFVDGRIPVVIQTQLSTYRAYLFDVIRERHEQENRKHQYIY